MSIIRKLLNQQMNLSKRFDEYFLSKKSLIDGNQDYLQDFLPNIDFQINNFHFVKKIIFNQHVIEVSVEVIYLKVYTLEKTLICSTVYDIGCGKNPAISIDIKVKLQAKVIGVDLSANELS